MGIQTAPSDGGPPRVETIMTRRVVRVKMDDSLRDVRDIFERSGFHHLVVVDGRRVVGLVSDRDLLKNISPFVGKMSEREQDAFTLLRRVHQIMTRKLVSCAPSATLAEAGRLMLDLKVSCLPVLDARGACVGILTMRDLLAWSLVKCAGDDDRCPVDRAA
jgi:acetoin utilization protein AcuB